MRNFTGMLKRYEYQCSLKQELRFALRCPEKYVKET